MLPGSLGQSSSQIVKKTVEMCAVLRWVHISTCFQEKWISSSQSQRPKGPSRLSLATEAKANVCHGMGVQQSKQHGWLAYVRRYYWHGGIYWDCTEIYTAIKMMSFMGSPWLLDHWCVKHASVPILLMCVAAIKIKIRSYLQNTFTLVSENFGNILFVLLSIK